MTETDREREKKNNLLQQKISSMEDIYILYEQLL